MHLCGMIRGEIPAAPWRLCQEEDFMTAIRLYRQDVYLREASAHITGVQPVKKGCLVTLDQTIFFPEGGGQSCDRGTLAGFPVLDVQEQEGEVCHLIGCTPEELAELTAPAACGDEAPQVKLVLDWDRRFDNMQRHCGEHIVSGIFHREYGGLNKGFHMGEDYMTIDISLEGNPNYDKVTWEMCRHVEHLANQVIWSAAPVRTDRFATREEAEALPLRKALAFDEDISIVTIGDPDAGWESSDLADCVACCGTHPATAAQVGLIKIYKVEANKGMFRIYLEAGQRAFLKYQDQYDVLDTLGTRLSAGTHDLLKKYQAQQDKQNEARQQLGQLRRWVIANEAEKIKAAIAADKVAAKGEGRQPENLTFAYDALTVDDLLNLAKELFDHIPKVLFLVHRPSHTVLLCSSGKPDCGKLVKENASIYGGKGGGGSTAARAIFTREDYVETFIDLIDKHLR